MITCKDCFSSINLANERLVVWLARLVSIAKLVAPECRIKAGCVTCQRKGVTSYQPQVDELCFISPSHQKAAGEGIIDIIAMQ
jgi:hypothetical protein